MKSANKKLFKIKFILLLKTLLFLSTASSSNAANDKDSAVRSSENTKIQNQKNLNEKNSKKSSSEIAGKTKSKDKGMHIKDETTDTTQNKPADVIEKKSRSPN